MVLWSAKYLTSLCSKVMWWDESVETHCNLTFSWWVVACGGLAYLYALLVGLRYVLLPRWHLVHAVGVAGGSID